MKIEGRSKGRSKGTSSSLALTPLELDIMKAVWQRHPATVRDVQAAILPVRPLAYTTVMTIMHRLYLKGFLRRILKARTHYYEPAVAFSAVRDAAIASIVDHFFQGSSRRFIEFLSGESPEPPVNPLYETPVAPALPPASIDDTLL